MDPNYKLIRNETKALRSNLSSEPISSNVTLKSDNTEDNNDINMSKNGNPASPLEHDDALPCMWENTQWTETTLFIYLVMYNIPGQLVFVESVGLLIPKE